MTTQSTYLDLKRFLTNYLSNSNTELKNIDKSQLYVRQFRNEQFDKFTLKDSRTLHMSVLLYRFKDELDVGEIFWKITRTMILSVLTNNPNTNDTIKIYLNHFELWKKNDLSKLIFEIATIYYNMLEIKISYKNLLCENENNNSLCENENNNSLCENVVENPIKSDHLELIDKTLQNIEDQCIKVGILDQMLNVVENITNEKTKIITNIVINAFWDKIEEDILSNSYETVLLNLIELKNNMKLILPQCEKTKQNYLLDECFDIEYFKQLMDHKIFDKTNVLNLLNIVCSFLKQWDSADANKLYDDEQKKITILIENMSYHESFRTVLEQCTELVNDFLLRKELWNKLLELK
jgi:hypothetical protein